MKKKVLISVSSVFVIMLGLSICFYMGKDNSDDEMYTSNIEDEKENSIGGFLTLMLETEAGSGQYQESTSSTWPGDDYVFNENMSACENGGKLTWDSSTNSVKLLANSSDACYVYFDVKLPPTLTEYIINDIYVEDGDNGLYYHDGVGTYGTLEAGDNSYRYSGANPNNYVCFGSDASSCPSDNLYRIIGVFYDTEEYQVKLIKADYAGSNLLGSNGAYDDSASNQYGYHWNSSTDTNIWSESNLNTINLNTIYIKNIGIIWNNKIAYHIWIVGGNTYRDGNNIAYSTPHVAYQNEIVNPATNEIYNAKIGLMYVSDYGYAASPENWNTELYLYDNDTNINNNWMYLNDYEWTITPRFGDNYGASDKRVFLVRSSGEIGGDGFGFSTLIGIKIRPVFYLNSDVAYASGDGSIDNPFRIVV